MTEDKGDEQYFVPMAIRDQLMPFRRLEASGKVPKVDGGQEPLMHVAQSMFMLGYRQAVEYDASEEDVDKQGDKLNCLGSDEWIFGKKKRYPPQQGTEGCQEVWEPYDI